MKVTQNFRATELARRATTCRVLLVVGSDSEKLRGQLQLCLGQERLRIRTVYGSIEAGDAFLEWKPLLVIAEMGLEEGRLLERLARGRGNIDHVPVIAVTPRDDLGNRMVAYDRGVDDLIVTPFARDELVAKAVAWTRRTHRLGRSPLPVPVGDLELDILHHRVRGDACEIHLTSLEAALLCLLADNPGRVLSRDEILTTVWGADYDGGSNVVDRHVRSLRTKLHDSRRNPRYIETIPGAGYRFAPSTHQIA